MEDTPQSNGMNEYAIVAANEHGKGKTINLGTYVGYDRPAAVTDAKVTATDDGAVQLAWTAPTEGANGGYVDIPSLKYTIGNLNGSSLLSTVVTTNAYSEQLTMKEGEQKLAWYTITPEHNRECCIRWGHHSRFWRLRRFPTPCKAYTEIQSTLW